MSTGLASSLSGIFYPRKQKELFGSALKIWGDILQNKNSSFSSQFSQNFWGDQGLPDKYPTKTNGWTFKIFMVHKLLSSLHSPELSSSNSYLKEILTYCLR